MRAWFPLIVLFAVSIAISAATYKLGQRDGSLTATNAFLSTDRGTQWPIRIQPQRQCICPNCGCRHYSGGTGQTGQVIGDLPKGSK